jgi:hypothetical protein
MEATLKYKLSRCGTEVSLRIYEQRFRHRFQWLPRRGMRVKSEHYPALGDFSVFIRGSSISNDHQRVTHGSCSVREAIRYRRRVDRALKNYIKHVESCL